jgi:hypothetical protein
VRLAVLLLLILTPNAPAQPPRLARGNDLASLSAADAARLQGKQALYYVRFDSLAEERDGRILVDCASPDAVHRTARLLRGSSTSGRGATVWGRLHIVVHPASWGFPELVEWRLVAESLPE